MRARQETQANTGIGVLGNRTSTVLRSSEAEKLNNVKDKQLGSSQAQHCWVPCFLQGAILIASLVLQKGDSWEKTESVWTMLGLIVGNLGLRLGLTAGNVGLRRVRLRGPASRDEQRLSGRVGPH